MRCPECHVDNRQERRFCGTCGAALPISCRSCGFANEPQARFCGGCGRSLETETAQGPGEAAGERRQVTILFADLVGFTRLSRTLDAEELHDLMGRFFAEADRIVVAYGGSVDKHIGDAVMAVFGAPVAHDDDPLRAARAALDIHAAVAALDAGPGRPLAVHAGIASGAVVAAGLGSIRHSSYTVLGDPVNLAARLVELAEAGQTLISDSVHAAVAPRAVCTRLGDRQLRGIDAPTPVWRLDSLGDDHRQTATSATPFVGRESETRQIAGILGICRDSGRGKAILLRGEAGIGKTRLVEEIARSARALGYAVHGARTLDFGVATGRDPARILARSLLGLDPASAAKQCFTAAEAALATSGLGHDARPFLLDLLDLEQPAAERAVYDAMDNTLRDRRKQETLAALVDLAARDSPVLLVVEDIHWADPTTLAYLAAATRAVRDHPAVLVLTARAEGDPLDAGWRATSASPLITIDLGPLTNGEAMSLASRFLAAGAGLAQAYVERAEGNPLFLEQLLRHAETADDTSVPATIQSLVLARMDRLGPADRRALQAAAVIGQQFPVDALRHLVGDPTYRTDALVDHYLLHPMDGEMLFSHALIREGVYGSLLKPRRRELHRRAADWFAGRDAVLAAQHLDRADDPAAAAAYLAAARGRAAGYHYEHALALTARGLELAGVSDDGHALACLRGELLLDLGRTTESIEMFERALAMAGTDPQRCQAWIGIAAGKRVLDRYDEAFTALDRAESLAGRDAAPDARSRINYLRGNLYFPLGRIDDCRREHERALAYAQSARSPDAEARALSGLADAFYAQGRMLTAGRYFERCIALAQENGLGRIEVVNRSMAPLPLLFSCKTEAAHAAAAGAVEAAHRVGHQRAEMIAGEIAYIILQEMGDLAAALAFVERSLEISRGIGARRFEAEDLTFIATVRRQQGRVDEARGMLREALTLSREVGMRYVGPLVLAELATVSDEAGRRAALAEGREVLRDGAISHCHLWFHRSVTDIHLEAGEWDEAMAAAQALADYTAAEPLPWATFHIARGRALARWGAGDRSPSRRESLLRLRDEAREARFGPAGAMIEQALTTR